MSFVLAVAVLSVVYLVVAQLERMPALRFRPLPAPRPYLATDLVWYAVAVGATATSVFVLRPQLARFDVAPIRHAVDNLPFVAKILVGLVVFDFVSFIVHVGMHRSNVLWNVHQVHHSTLHLDGFATNGVDPQRLELLPPSSYAEYLASYGDVDLILDPFPFSGSTTTCEALWMGVPVVTCPFETFASRHSLSHLSNIGVTELIAQNLEMYVELAVSLAGDSGRLAALRAELRDKMRTSPLCDGKRSQPRQRCRLPRR